VVTIIKRPLKAGFSILSTTVSSSTSHSFYICGEWYLFILSGDSSLALLGLFSLRLFITSSFYNI
jgi:hypothetical protein